jgi:hypothetical protein
MRAGVDIILSGCIDARTLARYSDFLERVDRRSYLGSWSYEVSDTKLARGAKPEYVIQLGVYSTLLGFEQRLTPQFMHIVLGDGRKVPFRVADFIHYQSAAAERLLAFIGAPPPTVAEPCGHCGLCRWRDRCRAEWDAADHLILRHPQQQSAFSSVSSCRRAKTNPPDDDIEAAKAMLANPDIGVTQIAHRLGVSPATLYRYIPAARTANTPGV